MTWVTLAVVLIVGQTVVSVLLLRCIKSFGQYTATNVEIHRTNIILMEKHEALITRLEDKEENAA